MTRWHAFLKSLLKATYAKNATVLLYCYCPFNNSFRELLKPLCAHLVLPESKKISK
jgi:hypothetical protein